MRLDYNKFIATLHIAKEGGTYTEGWNQIGWLPEGKRPKSTIYFTLYDNSVYQSASNFVIDGRLNTDGNISVYAFEGKERMIPYGSVSYAI